MVKNYSLSFILKIIVTPALPLKIFIYLKRFPNRVKSSLDIFCSFHEDLAVSLRDLVDFQVGITLTEEVHFVQLFARKFQAQLFSRINKLLFNRNNKCHYRSLLICNLGGRVIFKKCLCI